MNTRSGFVLIAAVGLSLSLLVLSLIFLQTMRADAEKVRSLEHEATCRLMLNAACFYVQETSRIGWSSGNQTTGWHQEAYGWRDIRDSSLAGPRDLSGLPLWTPGSGVWPDPGSTTRCVMYPMLRPPFARATKDVGNPLPWDNQPSGYNYGQAVYHHNPWPPAAVFVPEPSTNWSAAERQSAWLAHCQGDRRIRGSTAMPWFRIYRRPSPHFDTFIVTCGSGGTYGFRDWSECQAYNANAIHSGQPDHQAIQDEATFTLIRAQERLLWFEIRWSSAVHPRVGTLRGDVQLGSGSPGMVTHIFPPNGTATSVTTSGGLWNGGWGGYADFVNQAGTISHIQRLTPELRGNQW